jgi:hypothetical protein
MDFENCRAEVDEYFAENSTISVGSAKREVTVQKSQRKIPNCL